MKLLETLNTSQRAAVTAADGPVVIVAGPGTGKTKTLTTRIAYLLETGVPAAAITALTFTTKAAQEMSERVTAVVGTKTPMPRIATFHALGHEILSKQAAQPLRFISEEDRLVLIRSLSKNGTRQKGLSVRELAQTISHYKNTPAPLQDSDIARLAKRYNEALAELDLYDFDDLLSQAFQLLLGQKDLRDHVIKSCHYLLVDEFQDTNQLQYELMRLLAATGNVFVIGDPLQSIYGFRGASGDIFERFQLDFPDHTAITLPTNYRSAPEIVGLTNAVFANAPQLRAHQKTSGQVRAVQVLNEYSEADWIVNEIEQQLGGSDMLKSHRVDVSQQKARQFSDYAVLYRTHRLAKVLEQKLASAGLPYQVVGEGSPYEHPAIKTIIDVLRAVAGGEVLAIRGLSSTQLRTLMTQLDTAHSVPQLVQSIVGTLGLDQDELDRSHIQQFMSTLIHKEAMPLLDYLRHVDEIAQQQFYDPAAQALTLLTIHAAKGLEFTHVFLLGAEEGLLPFERKGKSTDLEEERRLFYVAVTRAAEQLDVLHAKTRNAEPAALSRFAEALLPEVLPRIVDPHMQDQQRRLHKRRLKKAQQTLF